MDIQDQTKDQYINQIATPSTLAGAFARVLNVSTSAFRFYWRNFSYFSQLPLIERKLVTS